MNRILLIICLFLSSFSYAEKEWYDTKIEGFDLSVKFPSVAEKKVIETIIGSKTIKTHTASASSGNYFLVFQIVENPKEMSSVVTRELMENRLRSMMRDQMKLEVVKDESKSLDGLPGLYLVGKQDQLEVHQLSYIHGANLYQFIISGYSASFDIWKEDLDFIYKSIELKNINRVRESL